MPAWLVKCKVYTKNLYFRWKSFEYDRMDRMLDDYGQQAGKPVDGVTTIIDMEGVGSEWLWRPGLNTYISLANLHMEHYPGIVKKLIVVNGKWPKNPPPPPRYTFPSMYGTRLFRVEKSTSQ